MEKLRLAEGQDPSEYRRNVLLRATHEFYCPVPRDDLEAYAAVFADMSEGVPDLRSLILEEQLAWRTGVSRDVWLCPALRVPDGRPDYDYLTRSDWRLDVRVVAPHGDAVRGLWLLRRFCDLYMVAEESHLGTPEGLAAQIEKYLSVSAEYLAEDLQSRLRRDELYDDLLEDVREAAEDAYSRVEGNERGELAPLDLSLNTEREQLFGLLQ